MRIAVLWKSRLMAEALVNLLESRGGFEVVSWSQSATECLVSVRDHRADAILAEESLMRPGERELLVGARLLGGVWLVVVSDQTAAESQGGGEGVDVFITGDQTGSQLCNSVRQLGRVEMVDSEPRRGRPPRQAGVLSAREMEVAGLVAKGYPNKKIAEMTSLHEQTVKNMISSILKRLGCENRTQMALKLANGFSGL